MKFSDLKTLRFTTFYKWDGGLHVLLPFTGYIVFGLANILLFSSAIKHIHVATAFAVWTGITLVFLKVCEVLFFHQRIVWQEVAFMSLIMIGIMGLKIYAPEVVN